jgi:hypothetical protein
VQGMPVYRVTPSESALRPGKKYAPNWKQLKEAREAAAKHATLIRLLDTYGMDAPTLNGIDVPKWKCWLPLK